MNKGKITEAGIDLVKSKLNSNKLKNFLLKENIVLRIKLANVEIAKVLDSLYRVLLIGSKEDSKNSPSLISKNTLNGGGNKKSSLYIKATKDHKNNPKIKLTSQAKANLVFFKKNFMFIFK